jgi:hypothetical protein
MCLQRPLGIASLSELSWTRNPGGRFYLFKPHPGLVAMVGFEYLGKNNCLVRKLWVLDFSQPQELMWLLKVISRATHSNLDTPKKKII